MPVNSFEDYPMSWKPVLNHQVKPLHLSLARQMEQDIKTGKLLPGTKLPPQRELADFLDINVSTVSKACKVCELKGLLSATVGSGTFVSFDALANAYLLPDDKPRNLIELGAVFPDTATFSPLIGCLKDMLNEADADKLFNYSRPNANIWLKDTAVKLMEKGGFCPAPANILFSNGGQNAISAILAGLCRHGDKIGADPHTYSGLKTTASMLGIQLIPIRHRDGEMDGDALMDSCRNENIKGIYLIPDHHNPTTHTMSIDRRRALAEIAREQNIFIIEDGAYHLLAENARPAVASFAPEQTIYIASMSKTLAPGLRMAYLSVPQAYRKQVSKALYNLNISVSPLMAVLAARVIVSGQLDQFIKSHQQNARQRNQLVNRNLSDYLCHGDETSIFRWLELPGTITGSVFEALAMEQGVRVYGAERFTVGNSIPSRAVRMSVCAPETLAELEQGLIILKNLLDDCG
ncbi:MAG: GntR family transcriptional regulator [Acetobacterium sp. MES1]|uniref:aminotransferase-like domain-containing protein n=1 Tax=Acetobacterium sp. MES1 TaxID=1899015 RepID=UPI000B9CFFED|nr:PLP-dependent aminotransferase family protein [Acetobacterium sp. MES1]OXS26078.1 MAG: GntR family transcriptional regulator [Acetobacterium sp. MES1]